MSMYNPSSVAEMPDGPSAGTRRQSLVKAAQKLLEEGGQEALTIRAVLTRTGLARRAFYECFAGKDDLVLAVFEDRLHSAAATLASQIGRIDNPMARLELIVTSLMQGSPAGEIPRNSSSAAQDRLGIVLTREHLRLADSCPAELQRALRPLLGLIADALADGIKARMVRDASPQRLASLIFNLVSTTLHREYLAPDGTRPDPGYRSALAGDIWEFCRRAIDRDDGGP